MNGWQRIEWVLAVVEEKHLSANAGMVLLSLCKYADNATGVCWPAQSTLRRHTNLSQGQMRRALQELRAKAVMRILTVSRTPGKGNRVQLLDYAYSKKACGDPEHPSDPAGDAFGSAVATATRDAASEPSAPKVFRFRNADHATPKIEILDHHDVPRDSSTLIEHTTEEQVEEELSEELSMDELLRFASSHLTDTLPDSRYSSRTHGLRRTERLVLNPEIPIRELARWEVYLRSEDDRWDIHLAVSTLRDSGDALTVAQLVEQVEPAEPQRLFAVIGIFVLMGVLVAATDAGPEASSGDQSGRHSDR
jgi:hypothetical protein